MIGPSLRRAIFWGIDSLKGKTIKKHYLDIKSIMTNNDDSFRHQLPLLLEYAVVNVPFYRRIQSTDINDFPIVTKNHYKEDYEAFKSQEYLNKPLHEMSTSGSTGTPFTVIQDSNKRKRTIAELIFFNEIGGQKLGERYLYIKAFPKPKSKLDILKQNVIPLDILSMNEQVLEQIRLILKKDKSIRSILAYASTYEKLADYLIDREDEPETFKLEALFSSSALLAKETKRKLQRVFMCPIIDRYSNQENGVLAQTCDTFGEFYVNKACYHVELLKLSSDEPVNKGELGRIVITDLYNRAMPIIRYDTGDLAISYDDERENLTTLSSIQGRRVDVIYDTKGNMLTPHTWSVHMRKYHRLRQWQFIQDGKRKYTLKVNGAEGVYSRDDFDKTLRSILGADAEIEIQYIDKIPVLSSGKFKNTICNYNPKG